MFNRLFKIFLSILPFFSYLGIFGIVNEKNIVKTNLKIDIDDDSIVESIHPFTISEAFTSFISLHIHGIEEEMDSLRKAIINNDNLSKEYINLLWGDKKSVFDGYFLSYMFLQSNYALENNYEFTAELFSYWINTPNSKKNHFWKLVDYFYTNIAPKIIGIDSKEQIEEIVNNTSNVKELSIDLSYENGEQESFIDLFPKSELIARNFMSNVISVSVKTWSLEDSMWYYLSRYSDKYFPLNLNDNKWVESSLIKKLFNKFNRMLTTRINDESTINPNVTYTDFESLNNDLRTVSRYEKNGQKDRYGIDLSNAIKSGINFNNELWNNHKAKEYFNLNKELKKTENKLLKLFNYLFFLYGEFYPNDNYYLYIIKNINIAYESKKESNGTTWEYDDNNKYGFVMGIWPGAWKRSSKIKDILKYETTAFENTFVHEFGHVVEMFIDSFDFKNGNKRLYSLHKNTVEYTFEKNENLKNGRLEELDAQPVINERMDEIVIYKNLETTTIYMNEDSMKNLYYEIQRQIESYIQWYSNDKWGIGKDLKNILENIDIYYGNKHLDEALTDIMESYNSGDLKEFNLKITSLYEYKNDIDLNFKIVNTKQKFKQLNNVELKDITVPITKDNNESINLVKNKVNNKLQESGYFNLEWKVVYSGKFINIEDIDFEKYNIDQLNIIATGTSKSEYKGYTFFKIYTSKKIDLSDVITNKDLGNIISKNPSELLNVVENRYPELIGNIYIDVNSITNNQFTILATEDGNYIGEITFTYNYVEDNNIGGETSKKTVNLDIIILGAIIGIVAIFVILIIRMLIKQRKNKGR